MRLDIRAGEATELVLSVARDAQSTFLPSEMAWAHLLTPALQEPVTASGLLRRVRAMHGRDLRLLLAGYHVRWFRRATPPETIAAAVDRDLRAMGAFLDSSYPWDAAWRTTLQTLLPLSEPETKRACLQVLEAWLPRLRSDLELLAQELRRRRTAARFVAATTLVREVTGGWEPVPEPGIDAIALVPTIAGGPHLHFFDHGRTQIVAYPAAGTGASAPAETDDLARLARALGDERRLRLVRLLVDREMSAAELAAATGSALTTLVHHLQQLKQAGAVRARARGGRQVYAADPGLTARLAGELERYLRS